MPAHLSDLAALPMKQQSRMRKQQQRARMQELRDQGLSDAEIARRVGRHRVTVARWLQQADAPSPPTGQSRQRRRWRRLPPRGRAGMTYAAFAKP